jgi:PAS domain S-box-containing protein/putative nucleotidyltransferase with HDIG domain
MEAIVVLALLIAAAWIVFGVRYADLLVVPRPYMLFPLLVWAALRSSQRGATTMQLPLAAIALGSTLLGMGEFPLGGQTRTDRLLLVQMFLSAASLAGLIPAAMFTERKRAEEALRESEQRYRHLFTEMLSGFALHEIVCDDQGAPVNYRFLELNPAFERLTGLRRDDILGKTVLDVLPTLESFWINMYGRVALTGEPVRFEQYAQPLHKYYEVSAFCPRRGQFAVTFQDVTERKQRDRELEAVATVSAALRSAQTRAEMLPIILEQTSNLLNAQVAAIGFRDRMTGETVVEQAKGLWANAIGRRIPPGAGVSGYVYSTGKPYVTDNLPADLLFHARDLIGDLRGLACMPLVTPSESIGWLTVGCHRAPLTGTDLRILSAIADIAANAVHRATLHEQTEHRAAQLAALHTIDVAISSSLDLRATFDVLLDQVVSQLHVDAADVLLLDPHTQTLECAVGRGFHSAAIQQSRERLGEGHAGCAALERRLISIPNDNHVGAHCTRIRSLLAGERFVAHQVAPLIAKGRVKGVLETFRRTPFDPEQEWLDFFEILAKQAAIAIDNAELFERLQRSNTELALAYDTTLEGWSRALDLRDRETEGHSQRVAELTVQIARAMGMSEPELVHVRRGALLHDIGKMGVPDAILLKPGKLTDEEWVAMKKHPQSAFDMLMPIAYLRQALDIPYCHHEKWEGTGYPRGLKGEQIPLSARIFAVVDVWDALRSDRPYRPAWSEEQARAYILEQAGKHFDPRVVEVFLRMVSDR